jgi:serine protease Do
MNKRNLLLTALLTLSLLVLPACSSTLALANSSAEDTPAHVTIPEATPTATQPLVSDLNADVLSSLEGTLETIYEQVNLSVVNIRVTQKVEMSLSTFPDLPGFPSLPSPETPNTQEYSQQAYGSGFVWDKQGHIVTNNHVIDGADKIEVTFSDGTVRSAELIGADPDSDLAVLKIDLSADQLHPVQIADSTQLKVGELAIAIGNPFGLEGSMTMGIVSALGRSLPVESDSQEPSYTIPDVIQTDAPINPGNSGGVLVNEYGQVFGVTSAIISPVDASAGIGFAIPSIIVQKVVPALIKDGHYDHPWLGLSGTTLSPDLAQAMGIDVDQRGALVVDIVPESPADKAGLHGSDRQATIDDQDVPVGGDVIVAIDGEPVNSFDDLVTYLVRNTEVGQKVEISILRDGVTKTVDLKLEARPETSSSSTTTSEQAQTRAWLGIAGTTVTPEIANAMNLDEAQDGVLVIEVTPGSPADQAGLVGGTQSLDTQGQQVPVGGDIIIAMDDTPMHDIQDLVSSLQQYRPGQETLLTILREGKEMQLKVTLGERIEG